MTSPVQDDSERPVPLSWRATLKVIADAFVSGQIPAGREILEVDAKTAKINAINIADYPERIGPLHEVSWSSSVHTRDGGGWMVLLDLSTSDGETSDLVLHVRVFEGKDGFEFEPGLIYVP